MKKVFSILLLAVLIIAVTGCGSSSSKESDVTKELTEIYDGCLEQSETYIYCMNWTFQEYLETYSSYRLLNTSKKEFTVKPQSPNSLFTYGSSRDSTCAYDYALFYNVDSDSYNELENAVVFIFNGALGVINYWIKNDFNTSSNELAKYIERYCLGGVKKFIPSKEEK